MNQVIQVKTFTNAYPTYPQFKNVFYFNGEVWTKDPHIQIELPKDTVVEGQVMEVFSGEGENTTPH